MTATIAGIQVPDSPMAREATSLVREAADDVLFDHSRRVFLWGSLKARARGIAVDPELAYVGGLFHDLGLTETYRTKHQRFEIDGADAARSFLLDHGRSAAEAQEVWLAIALHTTPEVPLGLPGNVAVVTLGVETDVLGLDLHEITDDEREAVTAAHPRPDFKRRILQHFYDGMADRPDTTFGTMNDDVLAHFDATFERGDFVGVILGSSWPE
ncbi:HD domain-containing protein [Nocardioides sp. CPCC 205120]|uniref:HD domain-containing protein n=1 Tax=Nocardioides sp. CPCC 205120 TaxID=3406462 RepID=UPI003B506EE8